MGRPIIEKRTSRKDEESAKSSVMNSMPIFLHVEISILFDVLGVEIIILLISFVYQLNK